MEKLIYVIWRQKGVSKEVFKKTILGPTAKRLLGLGPHRLSMNLADEFVDYAESMRMSIIHPSISGTISIWLDTSLNRSQVEEVISEVTARYAGYLVVESVPIVNTSLIAPVGHRTPGVLTVAFLERPEHIPHEEWIEHWKGHHTSVAVETQSTHLYIQNEVVRPLTGDAPPWSAIVEEGFPAEALKNPMVFYNANGSEEKLKENQTRMMESVNKFLNLNRVESHPMSEYLLKI